MLSISDAAPDARRDTELRTAANAKLLESLRHLVETCVPVFPGEAADALRAVAAADAKAKFSGMMHVYHASLLRCLRANDRDGVGSRLRELAALRIPGPADARVTLLRDGSYPDTAFERLVEVSNHSHEMTYRRENRYDALGRGDPSVDALARAMDRLRAIDPEMYQELDAIVSDVMLVRSDTFNAGTLLHALGIIAMSDIKPGQTWTRYLEHLAHEAGHHHLYYVWVFDPIVLNEDAGLFGSPIRREPRPLSGIYHAMFVLARTLRAIRRLRSSPDFDPDDDLVNTAYNEAENPSTFEEKFEDCRQLLEQHAKLTDVGRKLMESAREMAFA